MSEGGGAPPAAAPSGAAAGGHHYSVSSPSLAKAPMHPAGLPSTHYQNAPLTLMPTLVGSSAYEGRRLPLFVTRQTNNHKKGVVAYAATSPQELSPQKHTRRIAPGSATTRASSRMSTMEVGASPFSVGRKRPAGESREPQTSPHSYSLRKNSMPFLRPSFKASPSRNGTAAAAAAAGTPVAAERGFSPFHSYSVVGGAAARSATLPERGLASPFPNFIVVHGQAQELLATAHELGLLSQAGWAELDRRTTSLFHTFGRLLMEMQRPPQHQSQMRAEDTAGHTPPSKDATAAADDVGVVSTQDAAAHLAAAAATGGAPPLSPSGLVTPKKKGATTKEEVTAGTTPATAGTATNNATAPTLDLDMQSPLPESVFYAPASSATMPGGGVGASRPLVGGLGVARQTLRKSFKLSEAMLEMVDDELEGALVRLEQSPSPSRRVRPRQARIESAVGLEGDQAPPAHFVTSLALRDANALHLDHGEARDEEEDAHAHEADVEWRPRGRRDVDASYIISSRVHTGDAMVGATYDWETRTFTQVEPELRTEQRASFCVIEPDEEHCGVRVEYPHEWSRDEENGVGDENAPNPDQRRAELRRTLFPPKTIQTTEVYPEGQRTSLSFSAHSQEDEEEWLEDHTNATARRSILAPLRLSIGSDTESTVGTPTTPVTTRLNTSTSKASARLADTLPARSLFKSPAGAGASRRSTRGSRQHHRRHHRSQTFGALSNLPDFHVTLAPLPPIPSLDRMHAEEQQAGRMKTNASNTVANAAQDPTTTQAPQPAATTTVTSPAEDPHLAALRRARQREVARTSKEIRADAQGEAASAAASTSDEVAPPTLDSTVITSDPSDLLVKPLLALDLGAAAGVSDDASGTSQEVAASGSEELRVVVDLRTTVSRLEASHRVLEADLAASLTAQAELGTYVSHMRRRFLQRAFGVIQCQPSLTNSGSTLERTACFLALSGDGASLCWSRTHNMSHASGMRVVDVSDVRLALLAPVGGGVSAEVGLCALMDAAAEPRVTYDPDQDAFAFPEALNTRDLFRLRRELYRRVMRATTTTTMTTTKQQPQGGDAKPSSANPATPERAGGVSSPATDFFPSPLRSARASRWLVSFYGPSPPSTPSSPAPATPAAAAASLSGTLCVLFATVADLDVWLELMQRVWQAKHRRRLEQAAAAWRNQRRRDAEDAKSNDTEQTDDATTSTQQTPAQQQQPQQPSQPSQQS